MMLRKRLHICLLLTVELLHVSISAQNLYEKYEIGEWCKVTGGEGIHQNIPSTAPYIGAWDTADKVITLPIIVHVIHQGSEPGTGQNIANSRILSQLEVLNEDFRRITGTLGFNDHPEGADTEIDFCLARLGPDGFPLEEPGVDRVNGPLQGFSPTPYEPAYVDSVIKPLTIWDPQKYLNIWVLDLKELRGLAQFPDSSGLSLLAPENGPDNTDGIIVDIEEWGRFAENSGRTVTHEIGHYLGLIHTWGNSSDCRIDDGCEDTPPSNEATLFCPVGKSTCDTPDMIENYMDFTDGSCQNIFTQCQKLRMRTVLQHSPNRYSLTYSPVCVIPESAPKALFSFSFAQAGSCGDILQFHDLSSNDPFSWKWDFGNGTTADIPDPLVKYQEDGVYQVTLEVENFRGKSVFSQEIAVCLIDNTSQDISQNIEIFPIAPNPVQNRLALNAHFSHSILLNILLKDLTGRTIAHIYKGFIPAGPFDLHWFIPSGLPPGLYLIHWHTPHQQKIQKMMLAGN